MIVLEYAAYTDPGRVRHRNEDNYYIDGKWKARDEKLFWTEGSVHEHLTAAVCDGMGGTAKGEAASSMAIQMLAEYCKKKNSIDFSDILQSVNNEICREIQAYGQSMGTTFAGMNISGQKMTFANIGDSRIYRLRKGKLKQLSQDHSVVQRMVRIGMLTEAEARKHPQRHQITQYLGIRQEEMMIEPQIEENVRIENGDRYLLCSDGLTDMLSDEEIEKTMNACRIVKDTVEKLWNAAIKNGGADNITVILLEVQEKN